MPNIAGLTLPDADVHAASERKSSLAATAVHASPDYHLSSIHAARSSKLDA
jgi:hypothetical protein